MKCSECGLTKDDQKYIDVCDWCVNKTLKKMWDGEVKPLIKGFLDQIKTGDIPDGK